MLLVIKLQSLDLLSTQEEVECVHSVDVTDFCFADDIALLSNELSQAQKLLKNVETEADKVGLHVNTKKTKLMTSNQDSEDVVRSIGNESIKQVENFKYLGGWLKSSENVIGIRIALAWSACHKLNKIWKSSLKKDLKTRIFLTTVESVLLYNCNTCTLTKQLTKKLDGVYTRILRMALNVSWKQHLTNADLYGKLPPVSSKVAMHRLRLADHCVRHPEEMASQLELGDPSHGRPSRGRKQLTFIGCLKSDTGLTDVHDIRNVMVDRKQWKDIVRIARSGDRPK